MKILMIAPQPFLEVRGTPLSVLGRLKALSILGHDVDLLTYHVGGSVSVPNVTIWRIPRIPFIQQVPVGPSLRKAFLDLLLMVEALGMLMRKRYDVIHTHEEASFFGILLARLFGVPHLYDMHSSLPEQLSNCDYTRFAPVIGLFRWLERRVIRGSQVIIAVCPALEEHVRRIHANARCVLIENVPPEVAPETVSAGNLAEFKAAYSLNGRQVIVYAGSFEPYQGLDLLIDGAVRVCGRHEDVLFLVIGGKPAQVQDYLRRVRSLGLDAQFRFLGTRPSADTLRAVASAHVLVSPRSRGMNTPSKIYTYLQAGKAIVATNIETHTQVLSSQVALLVEPTEKALAEGILHLLENPVAARQLGQRARSLFEQRYGVDRFVNKTSLALQQLGRG